MRRVRRVLGWVATIVFFGFIVALLLAEELLPELLKDRMPDLPGWIAWTGLGLLGVAFLAFLAWVLFSPKHWRQWRQALADRRERRRRLANFELD